MQKLDQIQKFVVLAEGEDATFVHPVGQADNSRLIKMRINAPQACNLFITPVVYDHEENKVRTHLADEQIFLAHIEPGFEQIQFYYNGTFCLNSIGGDIWLDTYDNSTFSVEASDPTSFARLFEREERHPAILEMERMARHNNEAMRRQNAIDMEAAVAALEKRMLANVAPNAVTAPVGASGGQSDEGKAVSSGETSSDPKPDGTTPAGTGGEPA